MKYKLFGFCSIAVILCASFLLFSLDSQDGRQRVHQHLVSRPPDAEENCDKTGLCTHLPLVEIDTRGIVIPGRPITDENNIEIGHTVTDQNEAMLPIQFRVIDNQETNNHPQDEPAVSSPALIRIRGNSSRFFDKKSYLVRLTSDNGSYAEHEVMGMDPHYEWALYGPFLDKSLIRNYMWYNIAGEIMDYAPNVRFCEVIVNGTYQGLYVMTETITSEENSRLDLTPPMDGANLTGYVTRLDRGSTNLMKNIDTFTQYAYRNLQKVDVKYPRAGDLNDELLNFISQEISDFEKSLYSYDYDTDDYGYWHDIDTQSFIDYFIINEFTANYDAGWLSTYLYKDIGDKYKLVIWDFNSTCENYTHIVSEPQHIELQHNIWYYMLTKDEYFNKKLLRRYEELRKGVLSDEYLDQYVEDTIAYLGDAIDRNYSVWGYSFSMDMIQPPERNPKSQREAADQMKEFIHTRGAWMDENLEIILQYSHESKVKKFNH